jgi:hypothetical protein
MVTNHGKVQRSLVIDHGFSRRNAEIAIEMLQAEELSNAEKVVIERIMLNPDPEWENIPHVYYARSNPLIWVLDHLNYRITLAGGEAKICSRKRRFPF